MRAMLYEHTRRAVGAASTFCVSAKTVVVAYDSEGCHGMAALWPQRATNLSDLNLNK